MQQLDKYWIGTLIGILLPAIFSYIYIEQMHLWYVFSSFGLDLLSGIIGKLTVVALFPDMALLFLFYTTDTFKLAKGIIIGMFPYILAALIIAI